MANIKIFTGKVTFWNDVKCFGFIKDTDGAEHFAHISDFKFRPIQENDEVSFQIGRFKDREVAISIEKIEP